MKTLEQLEELLIVDLLATKEELQKPSNFSLYYNEVSGDCSIYLTSILHEYLFEEAAWNKRRWLDDSLLTKIEFVNNKCSIWGVVISGEEDTTKQWTDPLYFEVKLNRDSSNFIEYTFLFGDQDDERLDYKEYAKNRTYWDQDFYTNENWNPSERNWDFIINIKNGDVSK